MAKKSKTLARRKTGVGRTKTRTPVTRSISQHAKGVKKVRRSPHKKASYRGFLKRRRDTAKGGDGEEVTALCLKTLTGTPRLSTAQRLYLQEAYGDSMKWCIMDGYTSYANLIGMTGVPPDREAQIVSALEDLGK
jgi:hypothetical protein